MRFAVFGPFEIPRYGKKRIINKQSIEVLEVELEACSPGLSQACGCYVFAKRAGRGVMPWYIGQACRRAILAEALNPSNMSKYNGVLDANGTPLLFVLPTLTTTGKYRKRPEGGKLEFLNFLERWLITQALKKNANLVNTKETKFLRNLHVFGVLNAKQGEATTASRELCGTLGL